MVDPIVRSKTAPTLLEFALRAHISIPVEICINCTDLDSTFAAVTAARLGGAERVELCSRMDVGGLTPATHLVEEARKAWGDQPGLLAMIRCRPGDFAYSMDEANRMRGQIWEMAQAGADGVVLGAVRRGRLDVDMLEYLFATVVANRLMITCHRAFDAAFDPLAALALLGELDMDRVLTSGTPWGSGLTVADGVQAIVELMEHCPWGLEIVLGGGVDAATIGPILAQLPLDAGLISVHAYSSVLRNGVTDAGAVAELVAAARQAARVWMHNHP